MLGRSAKHCGAAALWVAGYLGLALLAAHADEACSAADVEPVRLVTVEARLELRLADGRLIRLAGLDPALPTPDDPARDEEARAAFAMQTAHHNLGIRIASAAPDRWGRIVAVAFVLDAPGSNLAALAIGAGLGRYRAETAAHACRSSLIAAEDAARAQKLGLWADPYYAVLAVDDRAGFAERAGTLVVAEGRLAAVETGLYRSTLIFTDQPHRSYGGQFLSATIPPRVMKIFEANGVHVSSLIGQSLRLRGLLDLRFGPQIELASPDDMDVVGAEPAAAASRH